MGHFHKNIESNDFVLHGAICTFLVQLYIDNLRRIELLKNLKYQLHYKLAGERTDKTYAISNLDTKLEISEGG